MVLVYVVWCSGFLLFCLLEMPQFSPLNLEEERTENALKGSKSTIWRKREVRSLQSLCQSSDSKGTDRFIFSLALLNDHPARYQVCYGQTFVGKEVIWGFHFLWIEPSLPHFARDPVILLERLITYVSLALLDHLADNPFVERRSTTTIIVQGRYISA